jgi:flagellar biogenesis protein FliO
MSASPGPPVGVVAIILAIAIASPAQAAFGSGQGDSISMWRVVGALMLCLGLACAGALLLKARGGNGLTRPPFPIKERRLKLQETLRVTPQVHLSIIMCDDRQLLFASSPQGVQLVRELDTVPDHETGHG